MTLESSKTLGGIGAILMFIGVFPLISYYGILEFVGAVLVLVALHGLAGYYKEDGIFTNALYGIVIGIVGVVVTVAVGFFVVYGSVKDLIGQIYPGWNGDWSTLQGMTPNTTNLNPSDFIPLFAALVLVFVILWVSAIIAAFFVRRSLKKVSAKSNVGLFGTAGLLLLIGAVIPLFGLLLIWIAVLLLAVAFFNLKPSQEPQMATSTYPPPPTSV